MTSGPLFRTVSTVFSPEKPLKRFGELWCWLKKMSGSEYVIVNLTLVVLMSRKKEKDNLAPTQFD